MCMFINKYQFSIETLMNIFHQQSNVFIKNNNPPTSSSVERAKAARQPIPIGDPPSPSPITDRRHRSWILDSPRSWILASIPHPRSSILEPRSWILAPNPDPRSRILDSSRYPILDPGADPRSSIPDPRFSFFRAPTWYQNTVLRRVK